MHKTTVSGKTTYFSNGEPSFGGNNSVTETFKEFFHYTIFDVAILGCVKKSWQQDFHCFSSTHSRSRGRNCALFWFRGLSNKDYKNKKKGLFLLFGLRKTKTRTAFLHFSSFLFFFRYLIETLLTQNNAGNLTSNQIYLNILQSLRLAFMPYFGATLR